MSELVIRRLLVDLKTPLPRRWNGGDAFRSALFNALSMSFPAGEQVFIDSVRKGLARLQGPARERFEAEARGFIGQEATHRRIHELFNEHLARQGFVNHWEPRIHRRIQRLEKLAGQEHNLWRDGALWQVSTWRSAWATLFGPAGLVRCHWRTWRRYLDADFHPSEGDGTKAARWLSEHAELAPPVNAPRAVA